MKDTIVTRISATFFHKHKYITNSSVTPEDRVMATEGKLAANLKGHMVNHLIKKALQQLERLGNILNQVWIHQDNQPRIPSIALPKHTSKV